MRSIALLALILPLLSACTTSTSISTAEPVLHNGRCTCESGLCVQPVGTPTPALITCEVAQAGTCAGLSIGGRRCWGSPATSGLCLCAGQAPNAKMAAN